MNPKGKIIVLGHDIVQEFDEGGTLISERIRNKQLLTFLPAKKEARIEIITSPSENSEESLKACCDALIEKGHTNFGIINTEKADVENSYYSRILKGNTIILIGSPSEIYSFFSANSFTELLHNKYVTDENFTLVGINTAAMALSDLMMSKKDTETGFGFIKKCIINTAFENRSDSKKLIKTVLSHQDCLGLAVYGGMSLIIEKGYKALCKGTGSAMIINAREVSAKSIKPFKRGASLFVKNLKGQVLVDGSAINLRTGNMIKPDTFDFSLNFTNRNTIS